MLCNQRLLTGGYRCPVCSEKALDPLGHHAITCTHGGDVVTRHNMLRDVVANLFRQVHMGVTVEVGHGLIHLMVAFHVLQMTW